MIEFKNISKGFKNNFWEKESLVLSDITFSIESGDLVGFLGANGAGKTTLIKILMGFTTKYSGKVSFSTELGSDLSEIRSNIGYLPEKAYLYPHLTGREFLNFIYSLTPKKIKFNDRVEELSLLLNIQNALDKKIGSYSKGMQQRLVFLSTIIHNPKLIILDEPLSGLDPIGRRDFKKIMKSLNEMGATIFFTSHVVSDVEEICNKVVFIEGSRLVYEGKVTDLLNLHSNNKFKIKFIENNKEKFIEDFITNKQSAINRLVEKNIEILSIEDEVISLEEIIYKIK